MGISASVLDELSGRDHCSDRLTSTKVLRYLLSNRPNQVVTCEDVCDALGYRITPQAISNAIGKLQAGACGLPVIANHGTGGGYILLVPVLTLGPERCVNCGHRTPLSVCKLTSRPRCTRFVGLNEWCKGWSACQS